MPAEEQNEPREKVLFGWKAGSRPFRRRSRDFYIAIISTASLFGAVLFLIEGIMPVLLIAALVFLVYVLSTVEPEQIEYQITNLGIKIADRTTVWNEMGRFWLTSRFNQEILVIEVARIPGRLELVVPAEARDEVLGELSKRLQQEKKSPAFVDKAAHWFSSKLPQE